MLTPSSLQVKSTNDGFSLTEEQLKAQIDDLDQKGKALSTYAFEQSPHYFKRLLKRYLQAKQDIKLLKNYAEDPLPDDQKGDLTGDTLPPKLNKSQIIEQLHATISAFHQFLSSRGEHNQHL